MKSFPIKLALMFYVGLIGFAPNRSDANTAAIHGMVASVNAMATDAGVEVLKHGGNAVDAAVAVAFTLGVVDTENSGLGGGCFMLIRTASGELIAIDGRETAPAAATRDMFVRDGKAETSLSQFGALASGVPGALAAYELAVTRYGRKPIADLILPAARLAEKGFVLPDSYARRLAAEGQQLVKFPGARAIFFKKGRLLKQGDVLRQPDLAKTYRAIAENGSTWFYSGPFSAALSRWMKSNRGIMTLQDMHDYRVEMRQPIVSAYRGYEIVGFGPPSSGGVHVAQILNILENFDLRQMSKVARMHVIAESMKLAFADRAYWLGDPNFAKVPRGLIDESYCRELAGRIRLDKSITVTSHSFPPDWERNVFRKHTTHFSVADAEGNWVACTTTLNTSFGSKVVIPGTGVVMNNQMDDFSIQPGVANFFGLIGGEANEIAPGKRPLSSMSPTIVLKNNEPIIALGAAGGPKIITAVVNELVDMLDLGMSPEQAVRAPRIHHQWVPNELLMEKPLNDEAGDLAKLGHETKVVVGLGISQIVAQDQITKVFSGAADPRADGKAAGW
jgi:gamma-glutamyltranspeptidase/glutathione hydrolase